MTHKKAAATCTWTCTQLDKHIEYSLHREHDVIPKIFYRIFFQLLLSTKPRIAVFHLLAIIAWKMQATCSHI